VIVQLGRANPRFPEWAAILSIVVIAIGGYALADPSVAMTREWWSGAVTWVLKTAGIVQIVSSLANAAGVKALQTNNTK
jgi:uncharacterized membrane protein HdeD (DUF308 family)